MLDSEDEDSEFGDDDENSYVTTSDCEVTSLKSEDEFDIDSEESFLQYFAKQRDEGLFISFEKGRKNQMYFLTTKEKKEEAENWIDGLLDHFLAKYGAKTCIRKFQQNQGEEPPRREKKLDLIRELRDILIRSRLSTNLKKTTTPVTFHQNNSNKKKAYSN